MAVKPIIDIELNAAAFDKFQQQFAKYQDALAKGPKLWRDVTKEQKASVASFQKMTEAMAAQAGMQRRLTDTYKSQNQHLMQGERLWGSMEKHATGIATSIIRATRSLLSWTGILSAAGGLLGAGSLFGIDRMARSVSSERRSAMGLGLSIGEQKAFDINFGQRLVDSGAFLGWINQMETDPRKAASAAALGVGLTGNSGKDSVSMLRALRSRALATPLSQLGMLPGMFGLEGVSGEDLRRLRSMSGREFEGLASGYGRDVSKLNIKDSTAEKWVDFMRRLDEAKGAIFKTFVQGLLPLERPLEHLSGAFEKFLSALLKSDVVKHTIENLATGLETFAGKLNSPDFEKNTSEFISKIGELADTVGDVVQDIAHPSNIWQKIWKPDEYYSQHSPGTASRYLARLDQSYGLPKGTTEGIWKAETNKSFDPNITSSAGAVGPFQFTKGAASDFHVNPHSWDSSASGTAAQIAYLAKTQYNGDIQAAIAARMGVGSKAGNDTIWKQFGPTLDPRKPWTTALGMAMKAHPNDWQRYLTPGESRYMSTVSNSVAASTPGIRIDLYNNTGGSMTAVASQIAH
jgi:hypothetical protein